MANIVELNIDNVTSSQLTASAGAASFTVPLGEADSRAILVVDNRASETARVVVNSGDGILSELGDLTVDVAVNMVAAIPLRESMRFKTATTQSVSVDLNDTADTSLTATPLALIKTYLIQG